MWRLQADKSRVALLKQFQNNDRVSFELNDEDVETLCARLSHVPSGSNLSAIQSADKTSSPSEDEIFESWRSKHPCILRNFESFATLLKNKRLAIFLDYDGTLTPIVSNPDEAFMSPAVRQTVANVARSFPTAVISGRGREKVENFVQLQDLFYAGSHGMDIAGPRLSNGTHLKVDGPDSTSYQPAAQYRPLIDQIFQQLKARLAPIPGASVEHNVFCVSAHYRNCKEETWTTVISAVEDVVSSSSSFLHITRGRKVIEVRPKVDWNKGTALEYLLGVLGLMDDGDTVAVYIGDDTTDEDAFRALKSHNKGYGILVTTKPKQTEAVYTVTSPDEVEGFLLRLIKWARGPENGWHANPRCNGWMASALMEVAECVEPEVLDN